MAFLALFGAAHLAIRRYAPYADPLLLPVVALLNGLGLVMIHRLDLGERLAEGSGRAAPTRRCCGRWSASVFAFVVVFLNDHRLLARYGYVCGLAGLIFLVIPALLPRRSRRRMARRSGFGCRASRFSPPSSRRSCC